MAGLPMHPIINFKKALLLVSIGFCLGTLIHAVGWADALIPNSPKLKVSDYIHPQGLYRLRYPAEWKINASDSAMIIKSPGANGNMGVFGIRLLSGHQTLQEAIDKEIKRQGNTMGYETTSTQVAGLPATKLVGSKNDDPDTRMVEYFLQQPNGHLYYIMLMAPASSWDHFAGAFYTIMRTLSFE
jgi:hypothetical protein